MGESLGLEEGVLAVACSKLLLVGLRVLGPGWRELLPPWLLQAFCSQRRGTDPPLWGCGPLALRVWPFPRALCRCGGAVGNAHPTPFGLAAAALRGAVLPRLLHSSLPCCEGACSAPASLVGSSSLGGIFVSAVKLVGDRTGTEQNGGHRRQSKMEMSGTQPFSSK